MRKKWLFSIGLVALAFGCKKLLPTEPAPDMLLAGPVDGLTPEQMSLHISGDEDFAHIFGTTDGLGPIFVQNSCESCHVGDGKGSPAHSLTRFGQYDSTGNWNPMIAQGGPQLQHRAILNYTPESLPEGAQFSQFIAPNVTGLGYLNALEDATLLAMADPDDLNGDGISGTVNYISAPDWWAPDPRYHQIQANGKYIGRFGRKSGAIDLLIQTVNAYKQDIGITSDFDNEDPVNPFSSPFAGDETPDPEIAAEDVQKVVFYLQTLKAPARRNTDDALVLEGEQLFNDIGCAGCHKANLTTGPSEIDALNRVTFHPYTDMLMHDMGDALNDNYTEGTAAVREWRTSPLWGLGLQQDSQGSSMYLMHHGQAATYEEAILLHGGEAAASSTAFEALTSDKKTALYAFLNSL